MSKPLHFVTKMDLICRGLDFEANVGLDYFRVVKPVIHMRREDCEPGHNAYCSVRSVDVITQDPILPRFTPPELFAAAGVAVEHHIDELGEVAEREGYYEESAKPVVESSMRIFPLPKPRFVETNAPAAVLREPVGPGA